MRKILDFLENKANKITIILIVIVVYLLLKQNSNLINIKREFSRNLDYFKNQQSSEREELKKQLFLLREELIRYKSQQEGRDQILTLVLNKNQAENNNILPSSTDNGDLNNLLKQSDQLTSTISSRVQIKGIIKLKNKWEKAEVYQEPRASAKILGEIVKDKLYFVYETLPNWLKIEYQQGVFGYVQLNLVDQL